MEVGVVVIPATTLLSRMNCRTVSTAAARAWWCDAGPGRQVREPARRQLVRIVVGASAKVEGWLPSTVSSIQRRSTFGGTDHADDL